MEESKVLRDRFEHLKNLNANGRMISRRLREELLELAKFFKEKSFH